MMTTALVSLPWHLHSLPSSQIAGLKSWLIQHGQEAVSRHYHKDVSSYFNNDEISIIHEHGIGEHIFGAIRYPERQDAFFDAIRERIPAADPESLVKKALDLARDITKDILKVPDLRVVGFTTTHVQIMSSLCVAKMLKDICPTLVVIFGGLHLDEKFGQGLLESFPEVDYVCVGEGEYPLLNLVKSIHENGSYPTVSRLLNRGGHDTDSNKFSFNDLVNLNDRPIPDISDYIRHSLHGNTNAQHYKICIETARGCFWGKCTFCVEGIRRNQGYRLRSAALVINDILSLSRTAKTADIVFTDPDMSNRRDVFQAIAESGYTFRLEAEVSGLVDLPTLIDMQRAGMRSIQIGIETFSPRILRRFAKGVPLIHYISLMRYCRILGMELTYNIIAGTPFETQSDIDEAIENMKKLWFLSPPIISEFVVTIGSPIYNNLDSFGIAALRPLPETSCYPSQVTEKLGPLLSFHAGFQYDSDSPDRIPPDYTNLFSVVRDWWDHFNSNADCRYFRGPDFADIEYKIGDSARHLLLEDPLELLVMDTCRTFPKNISDLYAISSRHADRESVIRTLKSLSDRGLVFITSEKCISLPLIHRDQLILDSQSLALS